MQYIADFQRLIVLGLTVAAFVVQLWAFIDSLRYKDENYRAVGKQSKKFWVIMLGVSLAIALVALPPISFQFAIMLNLAALVAGIVYLTDVRPKIKAVDPRHRGN